MQATVFNPADWVYVADILGRIDKGYYKNKNNPTQTLSVAAFERKRAKPVQTASTEIEQNINTYAQADGGVHLSGTHGGGDGAQVSVLTPWDNPVYGEQSASGRIRPAQKEAVSQPEQENIQVSPANQTTSAKPLPSKPTQPQNRESAGADSESEAGSEGTVICTELYRRGRMSLREYRSSHFYARTRLPASFMRGYQFWAIPYVGLMRRFDWAVAFIVPFVRWRTAEILYRLGKESHGSWRGKVLCALHDRVCTALGTVLCEQSPKKARLERVAVSS